MLRTTLALLMLAPASDEHWPHWRGPDGTGVARGAAPAEWSDTENVRWKVEVPGRGFSTPVVWGDKLFLTTAVPLGAAPAPEPEPEGDDDRRGFRSPPVVETEFVVLCLDRGTGKELWSRIARKATPHESYHATYGSHASISPVTDGERLYASFGSQGLYCYDLDGKPLWSKDFGVKMEMRNQFGEGAAPVVHGGVLVHLFDHEGQSFVVAVDAKTGEERWRADRDEPSCWATPLVTEVDGEWQVICSGTKRVRAYALDDGELLWECGGLGLNAIPAVQRHGDLVIAATGYREANMIAIELGGKGDLTGTDAVRWSTTKGLPYTASPVLHDGNLYAVMDRGFISCWDAATGKAHYVEERLPRGSSLKASPVAADGKLYVATESGDVHLFRLGDELVHLATNTLEDQFFVASPIVVGGTLYLRSSTHLFCIGDPG